MKQLFALSVMALSLLSSCNNLQKVSAEPESLQKFTDEQLMDRVQNDALKYFWDFAEPNSLMGRERYHEDFYPKNDANVVTTGGSGFGLMTILVGVERGFIRRSEAVKRLTHIADFLAKADRHHGAWPHWLDGETGKTVSFGKKDNGGDIVETAFLVEGIITVR